jgi:hypothetical protein
MGSWANSLHIRCDDDTAAQSAIDRIMRHTGFEKSSEAPKPGEGFAINNAGTRGIILSRSCDGWIGVLDSDQIGEMSLGLALSRELHTYAIQFFVNDSDAWYYQLYHDGIAVDEYESCDLYADCVDEDDLTLPSIDTRTSQIAGATQEDLQRRLAEAQKRFMGDKPAEIAAIQEKVTVGTATEGEVVTFQAWLQEMSREMMKEINAMIGEFSGQGVGPSDQMMDKCRPHVSQLRPIIVDGVDDQSLAAALAQEGAFAEHLLAEFLPLIGIASLFANLSYDYAANFTAAQLAAGKVALRPVLAYRRPPHRTI